MRGWSFFLPASWFTLWEEVTGTIIHYRWRQRQLTSTRTGFGICNDFSFCSKSLKDSASLCHHPLRQTLKRPAVASTLMHMERSSSAWYMKATHTHRRTHRCLTKSHPRMMLPGRPASLRWEHCYWEFYTPGWQNWFSRAISLFGRPVKREDLWEMSHGDSEVRDAAWNPPLSPPFHSSAEKRERAGGGKFKERMNILKESQV